MWLCNFLRLILLFVPPVFAIYIYIIYIYQNIQIHSAVYRVLNYKKNKNVLDLIFSIFSCLKMKSLEQSPTTVIYLGFLYFLYNTIIVRIQFLMPYKSVRPSRLLLPWLLLAINTAVDFILQYLYMCPNPPIHTIILSV